MIKLIHSHSLKIAW